MTIEKEIHDVMIECCPLVPPETGGILGGSDYVIRSYKFDQLGDHCSCNSYHPDVAFLNEAIKHWADKGIEFYGVFHSHPPNETTLSLPDIGYIHRIMQYLPPSIEGLYFPLIFPRDKMLTFLAARADGKIVIAEDTLVLL